MSQVPTADPLDFLWHRKGIPASGMTPRQFQSPQETMRQKLAAQEEDPGFFGGVKLAFNTGLTRTLAGYIATAPGKEDPNWELTPEAMTRFGEGLPNEWLDEFAGAVSEDHAIRIRANLLDLQETYRKLSLVRGNLPGWLPFVGDAKVSSALVFGAQVLDPATLLATAATNGAVNGFTAGGATAAGRVIRSGVANSGVNAALTAAEAGMSNPDVQVEDVLMAAGIGFGLGGAARGLSEHGLSRAAAERVVRDSEFEKIVRALDESGQPTTAEHITEVLGASAKRYTQQLKEWSYTPMERAAAVIDEHMPDEVKAAIHGEVENPPTTNIAPPEPAPQAAMGAAGAGEKLPEVSTGSPPEPPNKLATDFSAQRIADGAWVPPTAMSAVRGIMGELSNWLGKSPSNEVRRLALAAVDDTLPRGTRDNPVPTMFSANAWVHEQRIVAPRQAHANADASFHAWLDETGQRWKHNRGELHEHFMEEVGKAQQQPPGVYTTNKHINKAADGYRKLLMDMRDVAERHGVKGFDKFKSDPTWFPHWYSKPKIDAVAAKYGTQGIERVFRAALVSDSPDMDPKLINKIAKWMTRRIDLIGEHDELKNAMLFHSDAGDLLAKTLKEEVAGITDSEIESVVFGVQPRNKESGLVPNAKRRLRLDANVVVKLDDLNGNPGELRYTDLITTNAQQVADRYTSNIAGASAMAELYRVMKTSPDQVIETRQHLLDIALKDVRKEAENMGLSGQAVENLVRETEVKLDAVLRVIEGTPLTGNPRMAKIGQYVRDFNTMRLGGGFGIAQLADLGAGIAEAGFLPMMRHMPVLRQIRETIFGGGEMGARTRNELSRYLTMGDNGIHGDALGRFDATGDVVMDATDRAGRFFRRGAKLTGTISGMKALNRGIGHAAEAGIMETWAHYISTGRLPSKIRLAAMTLDEDMAKRIIAEGKKHSTISSNLFGHKFTELNIEKWDRQVAREFLNAVRQTSNRIAQRNDIGAQALWMSTWWGKILTQYKTFPINALQKQLLFNFHMRDMTAAYNTFWGLTMGAVTYYAYTEVAALGRPDREKYLAERLSPRNLALGAFQRSNISSVIPMFVDSAMWAGNYKPLFTARTSGLPSDLITGNPTFDLGNTAIAAFMRPVHAGSSSAYDLSQEDIAVMRRLFPWQNIWGVKQMIDAMSRDLPPRSQQQQN